ncbi:MAG: formylglycine-generating enzyme family protein [Lentisphaerae bacterium]|nr:formylglycine-generating enzyme family protein [Lentisphaerota bacterium]
MRYQFRPVSLVFVIFLCAALPCLAVQRMGIVQGNTVIAPNGLAIVASRCLDEHDDAPTTGHAYVKVLTDNPNDITVQVGDAEAVSMEQAVREGKISISGNDGPGGNQRIGNTIYFDPTRMRIHNLTDQQVVVSVKRLTPIGTAGHQPIGYDIGGLAGLSQREVWQRIAEEAKQKERKAKWGSYRAQAAEHNAVVAGEEVVNTVGMRFRLIPAGTFRMGSEKGVADEKPVHEVEITQPFYLGVTEVTQAQWEAVMGTNPSHFTGANRPVEIVSWEDAVAFCAKLSAKEAGVTYRLPTEAEWEYACRAGSSQEYSWHWSDQFEGEVGIDDYAWYGENSSGETHEVGKLKPNRWGLYDMHGNVGEWCQDWYDPYSQGKQIDPKGAAGGSNRVVRGGSWCLNAYNCHSAYRRGYWPSFRFYALGFRLVRMVP